MRTHVHLRMVMRNVQQLLCYVLQLKCNVLQPHSETIKKQLSLVESVLGVDLSTFATANIFK